MVVPDSRGWDRDWKSNGVEEEKNGKEVIKELHPTSSFSPRRSHCWWGWGHMGVDGEGTRVRRDKGQVGESHRGHNLQPPPPYSHWNYVSNTEIPSYTIALAHSQFSRRPLEGDRSFKRRRFLTHLSTHEPTDTEVHTLCCQTEKLTCARIANFVSQHQSSLNLKRQNCKPWNWQKIHIFWKLTFYWPLPPKKNLKICIYLHI